MIRIIKTIIILLILTFTVKTFAHGGEDHDIKKTTTTTATYFSTENSSEIYEVLIKYGELSAGEDAHFTLFLSDVKTNKPIANAQLVIVNTDNPNQKMEGKMKDSGIYEFSAKLEDKKIYSFNVSINGSLGADLIQVSGIEVGKKLPQPLETTNQTSTDFFSAGNIVTIIVALFIGLFAGLFLKRNSKAGKKVISIFLLCILNVFPFSNFNVHAHGGEEHEEDKKGNNSESAQIIVSKETQFLFGVTTLDLQIGNFTPSINLFGTLLPTSSGKAVVQTPQTGIISSLNVIVGQNIAKGQLLAVVEQNIDAGTQISWLTQKNNLNAEVAAAKKEYDRLKSIADIAAKKDVDEAERRYNTAATNLKLFEKSGGNQNTRLINLYSPINGRLDNFNFSLGATINAGQDIFTVTNLSKLYAEAQVFDKDAGAVKNGKEFLVESTDNLSTQKVKLLTMGQSINPTNQSQKVLFEMDNEDSKFKIGEFVNIRVFSEAGARNIAIPNSAITEINGKPAVFIKDAAEKYTLSYISPGENNGQYTTVLRGIEEGERVVINGTYQLKIMYLNQ